MNPGTSRARMALGTALAWALLAQVLAFILRAESPLARTPIVDAKEYWAWAGRVAEGQWVGTEPFFSAPLYPYVLGGLRAVGGGLEAALALNGLLWIACAALVGRVAWRRYGARAGALATWVFVLAQDPFASSGRILAGSLQCFLVIAALERAGALRAAPGRGRAIALGVCAGLACLAWPVLLPAVLLFGLWAAWALRAKALGAMVTASAILTILPATLHNVAAAGEWIPISAHGGVTFYHGNNAAANGTYSPLGVSSQKEVQNREAREQAEAALGKEATWSEVSSYFFGRGLDWWKSAPSTAFQLAGVKLRYFLFGRNYGDIYPRGVEARESIGSWLHLAPIPLPAILCLGLAALAFGLLRDSRQHVPDLVLVGAALGVCVVFWYTPRYRVPAAPVIALLAGWGLAQIADWRGAPKAACICAAALVLGLTSGVVHRATGFDSVDSQAAWFQMVLGQAHRDLGELDAAETYFQRAQELGEGEAAVRLADLARERGDYGTALVAAAELADKRPQDSYAQRTFAVALAEAGRVSEAIPFFEKARDLAPEDWRSVFGLGQALAENGQLAEAIRPLARAAELAPREPEVAYMLAFCQIHSGAEPAGIERLNLLLKDHPDHEPARQLLVDASRRTGDAAGAVQALADGLERDPDHIGMGFIYAWLLATSRDDALRNGALAVQVATGLCERTSYSEAELVDVLAAALAEAGRFEEASERAQQAMDLLPANADTLLREAIQARVHAFSQGQPYRE